MSFFWNSISSSLIIFTNPRSLTESDVNVPPFLIFSLNLIAETLFPVSWAWQIYFGCLFSLLPLSLGLRYSLNANVHIVGEGVMYCKAVQFKATLNNQMTLDGHKLSFFRAPIDNFLFLTLKRRVQ